MPAQRGAIASLQEPRTERNLQVLVYLATVIGVSALVTTWAVGLNADVGGLIALAFVGLGILAEMATRERGGAR
jgi:hypothetical protein